MKRKCVFSICIVTMLTALSIATFAGSLSDIPEQRTVSKAAVTIIPEEVIGPRWAVTETAPTERSTETPNQSVMTSTDWNEEELYLLAKIAMAEAENEDTEGKALVMLVVLNRVKDDEFPDNIEDVIYQPVQFSPIANGRFDKVEPDADCWAALKLVMQDKWDKSCGATYFESKSDSTWHEDNLQFLFQHGKHYFYSDKERDNN